MYPCNPCNGPQGVQLHRPSAAMNFSPHAGFPTRNNGFLAAPERFSVPARCISAKGPVASLLCHFGAPSRGRSLNSTRPWPAWNVAHSRASPTSSKPTRPSRSPSTPPRPCPGAGPHCRHWPPPAAPRPTCRVGCSHPRGLPLTSRWFGLCWYHACAEGLRTGGRSPLERQPATVTAVAGACRGLTAHAPRPLTHLSCLKARRARLLASTPRRKVCHRS